MAVMIRRTGMTRILVALTLAVSIVSTAPAVAQSPSVTIDVRQGLDGVTRGYTPNLMTVTITADVLFSGAIEFVAPAGGGAATYRQPIEVPAASRKSVVVITPRASVSAVRAVDRKGVVVAKATLGRDNPLQGGEPLIGWLGAAAPAATSVEMPIIGGLAPVVRVPIEALSFGVAGLEALSHVVVDGALVPTLSPTQLGALRSYAGLGGEVIVAAGAPSDVTPLDKASATATRGDILRTRVGRGGITAAMIPAGDGRWRTNGNMWARTLRPVAVARWNDRSGAMGMNRVLSETRLFRRGALGWLLIFVLLYVALVGPVNFMVLARKRKREMAWVTVPAISLVFALIGYGLGFASRSTTLHRGAALYVLGDGIGLAEVVVGRSERGGAASLALKGPWVTEATTGVRSTAKGRVITFGRDSLSATFDLTSGDVGRLFGQSVARSSIRSAGSLALRGAGYAGSITNTLGIRLDDPAVWVGRARVNLGDRLDAGVSTDVTIDINDRTGEEGVMNQFFDDGSFARGPSTIDPHALRPGALYSRAAATIGLGRPGAAYLTGWVNLADLGRTIGTGDAEGPALVAIPISLGIGTGATPEGAIRSDIVWTDGQFVDDGHPGSMVLSNGRSVVVRFTLPDGAADDRFQATGRGDNRFGDPLFFQGDILDIPQGSPDEPAPPVLIGPDGAKFAPRGSEVGPGFTSGAEVYDFASGTWVSVKGKQDGSLSFANTPKRRYRNASGELFLRFTGFNGNAITASTFTLEGVAP